MRGFLVFSLTLALTGSLWAQHPGDIWLGQTSSGQLTNAGVDLSNPIYLSPTDPAGALGGGWALNDPGFDHVVVPEADTFPLAPTASLSFEVVSMTPGLRMLSPDLSTVVTEAGQGGALGGSDLHVHWNFQVMSPDHPDYEDHSHYHCTLEISDSSGAMTTSAPITIYFQTEDVQIGDVDLDGQLTALDFDAFNALLIDPLQGSSAERVAADANLDGVVDTGDLCAIQLVLGLSGGFVRGDANSDLTVNIADAVAMLDVLFSGGQEPLFVSALDSNNDAQFDIADPIHLLAFLFSGGDQPASPFPLPGCP